MNQYQKWLVGVVIVVSAFVIINMFFFDDTAGIKSKKWDDCLALVNKAIPDPNDTVNRSYLLQTCYEK